MLRMFVAAVLAVSLAATSVVPAAYAQSKPGFPTPEEQNMDREFLRLIQLAIRDEINALKETYQDLLTDLRAATTRADKRAIRLAIRPIRSQIRRLTNRLRLSRTWSSQRIRYWARVYLPPDVSAA